MKIWMSPSILFCLLISLGLHAEETSYVLVSSRKTSPKFNQQQVKKIFLGKKVYWPNGEKILVVYQRGNSKYKESFLRDVLDMSTRQFEQYWQAKLFSGLGFPPIGYKNTSEMLAFLNSEPRAVGLISKLEKTDLETIFSLSNSGIQPLGLLSPSQAQE